MLGIGFPELIVILIVALVIFGPGKLPEIGSALGQGLRDFQRAFGGHEQPKAEAGKPKSVDAHGDGGPPAA